MKLATWNVNSVKARLPLLLRWLKEAEPDIVLLQEIKVVSDGFPELEIGELGYNVAVNGQKTYNGVAILAKRPIEVERRELPGDKADSQARYLEALVDGLRVASIYLPNGNPVESEKYPYKLAWMRRLEQHARALLALEEPFVLGGDYNIIPEEADVYDPAAWKDDALFRLESRRAFRAIVHLGLTDAFRTLHREPHRYTYWDYQSGRWSRDEGLRIDHLLLSPQAADRLAACDIDRTPRKWERASDHTPVWCELAS
ncbi:MAG TPA: exodeoxyribonuclease III [Alphaproteobacteria bacterium]|nr:exodeoxyribonuclease III [Alphaproteobacteria bacterium]